MKYNEELSLVGCKQISGVNSGCGIYLLLQNTAELEEEIAALKEQIQVSLHHLNMARCIPLSMFDGSFQFYIILDQKRFGGGKSAAQRRNQYIERNSSKFMGKFENLHTCFGIVKMP